MKLLSGLVATLILLGHSPLLLAANSVRVHLSSEGLSVTSHGLSQAASTGTTLKPGDRVSTGEKGGAILILQQTGAQTALKLRPRTRIRILESKKGEPQTQQIAIEEGGLLAATQNSGNIKRPFRISTRTATLGVRGTGFFLKAHEGQPIFLCVCQGEVELKSRGDTLRFKSKHHDHSMKFSKTGGQLASRLDSTPMGDEHSDADGAELVEILHHF